MHDLLMATYITPANLSGIATVTYMAWVAIPHLVEVLVGSSNGTFQVFHRFWLVVPANGSPRTMGWFSCDQMETSRYRH